LRGRGGGSGHGTGDPAGVGAIMEMVGRTLWWVYWNNSTRSARRR